MHKIMSEFKNETQEDTQTTLRMAITVCNLGSD